MPKEDKMAKILEQTFLTRYKLRLENLVAQWFYPCIFEIRPPLHRPPSVLSAWVKLAPAKAPFLKKQTGRCYGSGIIYNMFIFSFKWTV